MSLRSKVLDYLRIYPDTTRAELREVFRDDSKGNVDRYYTFFNKKPVPLNIREELEKIIKDYKQPDSARVQAIREYNTLVEPTPESNVEDPLMKLLKELEEGEGDEL